MKKEQLQGSVKADSKQAAEASAAAAAAADAFTKSGAATQQSKEKVIAALTKEQSAVRMAYTIYKEEGMTAFWRGNLPSCMRVAGTAAINFTCMDYYKRVAVGPFMHYAIVQRRGTLPSTLHRRKQLATSFVSGGLAGATSTTVLYPFEFLRTRLALDVGRTDARFFTGMSDVVSKILKSDGILGFYQGYGIALVGGIYYRVLYLGGYDAMKSEALLRKRTQRQQGVISERTDVTKLSWTERIVMAQSISLMAGTLSYPADSVRRRMMMQAGVDQAQRRYRNSLQCISIVYKQEGIRGFFLGLGPNIVRSIGGALLLVGYDTFRTYLH